MSAPEIPPGLPGAELVGPGLSDLREGRETVPSLLVEIVAPRLRRLGIDVPRREGEEPERRLVRRLERENPRGVHGRYNALVRRVDSFASALEAHVSRARRSGG